MGLFQIKGDKLMHIHEKKINIEKRLQKLIEQNLESVFDLQFVDSEFPVRSFRIDTLAFNSSSKSFVVIEYKRDKSTSIIDQGYSYLNALLENQAEFVLRYNEKLKANLTKNDVQWDSSKVIFVANAFSRFQEGAAGYKNLPIELWEAELYENDVLSINRIEGKAGVPTLKPAPENRKFKEVESKVKTYEITDLFKPSWKEAKELYENLDTEIRQLEDGVSQNITKFYIAYMPKSSARSFVEIVPQKQGLKVYLRPKINEIKKTTTLKIEDCSTKGHWTNGNSSFLILRKDDINDAMTLIKETFEAEN